MADGCATVAIERITASITPTVCVEVLARHKVLRVSRHIDGSATGHPFLRTTTIDENVVGARLSVSNRQGRIRASKSLAQPREERVSSQSRRTERTTG